ncbi:MAG: TolC family protein [Tannerellaceae bacterium]|jgi:outer membrane protein TolC|nr:TolC family protein [Tannerellaceae bacterium]
MQRFLRKEKIMASLLCAMLLFQSAARLSGQTASVRLDLDKALEIAMSENPTVQVADREIEKKKYAHRGAYAALFPQISLSADYSRTIQKQVMYMGGDDGLDFGSMFTSIMDPLFKGTEETLIKSVPGYTPGTLGNAIAANTPPPVASTEDEGFPVGRLNSWGGGLSAGMPLVNVALWKSLKLSGADVELAIEQARSSKIDMTNQVRKSYYGVLLAGDSYRVFKNSYDNAMSNYNDIKNKFDQGLVAEYDLIRAGVSVRNIEPNLLQAENAVTLAKWQLKALLGMDLDLEIECEGQLSDYQSGLFAEYLATEGALAENSTLRQLEIQQELLRHTLAVQKADFLPTMQLSGVYQWSSMNNDFKFKTYRWNPYSMVQLSLSMPLFTGGSRLEKIRQTRVSMHQLQLQRGDVERSLHLALKQFQDNMNSCLKRFNASQKGVEQAERGYTIARKRYDTGAGTLLEMNDAELALTQARLNFNQSIYEYMVSKSEMEKLLGKQHVTNK